VDKTLNKIGQNGTDNENQNENNDNKTKRMNRYMGFEGNVYSSIVSAWVSAPSQPVIFVLEGPSDPPDTPQSVMRSMQCWTEDALSQYVMKFPTSGQYYISTRFLSPGALNPHLYQLGLHNV
jgi:hypothetical protein